MPGVNGWGEDKVTVPDGPKWAAQNGKRQWDGLSEGGISGNVSTPDGPKWTARSGKKEEGGWEVGGGNVQVFSLQTALNGRPGADKRKGGFGGGGGECASVFTSDGPKWTARSGEESRRVWGGEFGMGSFHCSRRP